MPRPLGQDPDQPGAEELLQAHTVLLHARGTAQSFLDTFEERLRARGPGAPSDQDYDLMRAMLVFACAGLDATIKHLVRDALPALISRADGIEKKFEEFVAKELEQEKKTKLLASVLTSGNPRQRLVEELVKNLTSSSLQSKQQILRVASFFVLGENDVFRDKRAIDDIFRMRNTIAHEMDVDFDQPRRTRTPRPKAVTIRAAKEILGSAAKFLHAVDGQFQAED